MPTLIQASFTFIKETNLLKPYIVFILFHSSTVMRRARVSATKQTHQAGQLSGSLNAVFSDTYVLL